MIGSDATLTPALLGLPKWASQREREPALVPVAFVGLVGVAVDQVIHVLAGVLDRRVATGGAVGMIGYSSAMSPVTSA